MSINRLFLRRWVDHYRKQLAMLRYIFDWIVLLYIGIPGMLLLGRIYYGLWMEELPSWLQQLPATVLPAFLLILIYGTGGLMLFIEAADVLFLKQRRQWQLGLMLRGALAELLGNYIILTICFVLISPILIRGYGIDLFGILLLLAGTCAFKSVCLFGANLIQVLWSGWKRIMLQAIAFSVLAGTFSLWMQFMDTHPPITAVYLSICAGLTLLLAWRRFRLRGKFDVEVQVEERQKARLTGLLLAGAIDRPPAVRSRPWLFRRGGRLLRSNRPEDRIAEATFKSYFRGPELRLYLQFVLFGSIAIYFPSYPVNLLIYAALMLLLVYWLNSYRQAFYTRNLMTILPLGEYTEYRSAYRTMRLLLYPAVAILTLVLGISLFPAWWGALIAIPASLLMTRFAGGLWRWFPAGIRRGRKL